MNDNRKRLKALLSALGLTIADAARVIKVSRPLLSRVLSGDTRVNSDAVFTAIENHLPQLVSLRTLPLFDLPRGVPLETVTAAFPMVEQKAKVAA